MVQWPRPELWLLWCFLPILAAQGASEAQSKVQQCQPEPDQSWATPWEQRTNQQSSTRLCIAPCFARLAGDLPLTSCSLHAEFVTSSGSAVVAGMFFGLLIPLAFVAASFYITLRYVSPGARMHQV